MQLRFVAVGSNLTTRGVLLGNSLETPERKVRMLLKRAAEAGEKRVLPGCVWHIQQSERPFPFAIMLEKFTRVIVSHSPEGTEKVTDLEGQISC